jgi:hypothetical protein
MDAQTGGTSRDATGQLDLMVLAPLGLLYQQNIAPPRCRPSRDLQPRATGT